MGLYTLMTVCNLKLVLFIIMLANFSTPWYKIIKYLMFKEEKGKLDFNLRQKNFYCMFYSCKREKRERESCSFIFYFEEKLFRFIVVKYVHISIYFTISIMLLDEYKFTTNLSIFRNWSPTGLFEWIYSF